MCIPQPTQGWLFHRYGMLPRNRPLPLCVYSVEVTVNSKDFFPNTSKVKNKRTNVAISFWKWNQNILVSFPNLYCWEQIVSIWSRICSPGPNRDDLFRRGRFGNGLRLFGFIPVRCGGRLWNVCSFTVLTLLPNMSKNIHSVCTVCSLYTLAPVLLYTERTVILYSKQRI